MRVAFGDLLGNGTEREGRSVWLVATLGPLGPGVKWSLCGAPGRCRGVSTDQTTISVVTDEVFTFGLKSWSRGQKSQAASAVCSGGGRPSWAPPISMHTLSAAVEHSAISCRAHCLFGAIRPIVGTVCQAQLFVACPLTGITGP